MSIENQILTLVELQERNEALAKERGVYDKYIALRAMNDKLIAKQNEAQSRA